MKTVQIQVADGGVPKVPVGVSLPPQARLAVLVLDSPKADPRNGVERPSPPWPNRAGRSTSCARSLRSTASRTFFPDEKTRAFETNGGMFQPGEIVHAAFRFTLTLHSFTVTV